MSESSHFTPAIFEFLSQLRENNDREWFELNKQRYVNDVRDPLLRFVGDFKPHLEAISPHFIADARPTGGSMFRIYRDTRFSTDKSPYKTHAAVQFRHDSGKDVHAPGFYLHVAPGEIMAGCGLWHPDAPTLSRIRTSISAGPEAWKAAVYAGPFAERCKLGGESLSRPPKGFDASHPFIEDIKRKDFIGSVDFSVEELLAPDFLARYVEACRAMAPLVHYLTLAIGLQY